MLEVLKYVGLVLGGVWSYLAIGTVFVIVGAFVSKLKGGGWFAQTSRYRGDSYSRWTSGDFPQPAFVFFGWPLMVVIGPPLFMFFALGDVAEGLTNRVHALIERRQDAMAKLAKPNA